MQTKRLTVFLFLCALSAFTFITPVGALTITGWTVDKVKAEGKGPHTVAWSATYTGGGDLFETQEVRLYDDDVLVDDLIDTVTADFSAPSGTVSGTFKFWNDEKNRIDGTPNGGGAENTGETVAEGIVKITVGTFPFSTTFESPVFSIIKDPPKPVSQIGPHAKDSGSAVFTAITNQLAFPTGQIDQYSSNGIVQSDPVVGALVQVPTMMLQGQLLPGEYVFTNEAPETRKFEIANGSNVFMRADLEALGYHVADNVFYWIFNNIKLSGVDSASPFFDPTLPDLGSQYIAGLASQLDPASPDFSEFVLPYYSFTPDTDIFGASAGFTSDLEFQYRSESGTYLTVSEPATAYLLGLALLVLATLRTRPAARTIRMAFRRSARERPWL